MYVTLVMMSIVPILIVIQVVRIHLLEGSALRAQGEQQASSYAEIPAIRGAIFDRAGRVLAVNTARYELAIDPTVKGLSRELQQTFFEKLSRLTGRPVSSFTQRVQGRKSPQYVLLMRDLSEAQVEEILSWDIPGVILEESFSRRYTYGKTAAHILGHVDVDGKGIAGVEEQYDSRLRGVPGRRMLVRDRLGTRKAMVGGRVIEPQHGESIVLTIDLIRQTILEEELARGVAESGASWGTAIAMDPHTGEILALANVPTYDPNNPAAYPTRARRNHAITDRFEPGSTFKLVTAVAAVEQGIVSMDDTIDTGNGSAVFGGRTVHDTHALGRISFADVIAFSSNVGSAWVGTQLEKGVLYQYARNLGFGQPTWIDLPGEVGGLLKKPSAWSRTTHSRLSFGYEVDVTPLQMLTAYAALANGGVLVHPHVVAERRDVTGQVVWKAGPDSVRRAFKRETVEKLLPAFERAVVEGTATRALVEGLPIAGKTGTARKVSGGAYRPGLYRASFVGFFPADDPSVALIVVLDEPTQSGYGGMVAAPIFKRIVERWVGTFPKIAERLSPVAPLPGHAEAAVPDVTGNPAGVARNRLATAGYEAEFSEKAAGWETVAVQQPVAGEHERIRTVRLTLSDNAVDTLHVMPDLTGLGARQATYWLMSRGVTVRIEGSGMVTSQSPKPGDPVRSHAVLHCQ